MRNLNDIINSGEKLKDEFNRICDEVIPLISRKFKLIRLRNLNGKLDYDNEMILDTIRAGVTSILSNDMLRERFTETLLRKDKFDIYIVIFYILSDLYYLNDDSKENKGIERFLADRRFADFRMKILRNIEI